MFVLKFPLQDIEPDPLFSRNAGSSGNRDIFDEIIDNAIKNDNSYRHFICLSLLIGDSKLDSLINLFHDIDFHKIQNNYDVNVKIHNYELKNIYLRDNIFSRNYFFMFEIQGNFNKVSDFAEYLFYHYACVSYDDAQIISNVSKVNDIKKEKFNFVMNSKEKTEFMKKIDIVKADYLKSRKSFNLDIKEKNCICSNKIKLNDFFSNALRKIKCENLINKEISVSVRSNKGMTDCFFSELKAINEE